MHLQQTKAASRQSGGPQYYFHDLSDPVKDFLRKRGAHPVVLQTPYGIAKTPFMAVGCDHKLTPAGEVVAGRVGHDRIQAGGDESIGEAIRRWYALPAGRDFEKITVDVTFHRDGHFILVPLSVKMRGRVRELPLEKIPSPLSFHRDYQSKFWRMQIDARRAEAAQAVGWAAALMEEVVTSHRESAASNVLESDLLRAAGALSILGLGLSPYLGKGFDCLTSRFTFDPFPDYVCPVEIKKRSSGFSYQVKNYTQLPRLVILCMEHNLVNPPEHVDVIELPALAEHLGE